MLQACFGQRVTSARELVYQLPDAVAPSLGAIAAIVEQQNEPEGIRGEGPSGEIALGEKGVEAGLDAILLVPHRNCNDRSQRWSDGVWQLKHQLPSRRYALTTQT